MAAFQELDAVDSAATAFHLAAIDHAGANLDTFTGAVIGAGDQDPLARLVSFLTDEARPALGDVFAPRHLNSAVVVTNPHRQLQRDTPESPSLIFRDKRGRNARLVLLRRREVRTVACIRSREFGEELVKVRNVSRSGLCFEGHRAYEKDWKIEVAVPISSGGGNIFLPARIARVQKIPSGSITLFGVEYIRL